MSQSSSTTGFRPRTDASPSAEPVDGIAVIETGLARASSTEASLFRTSIEVAHQFPRDEQRILTKLLTTLDSFPQFAEKALYSIKFGDGKAEGLTIRAAETIAAEWGNIVIENGIISEDENGWDLYSRIFDMQANYRWTEPARASKWIRRKDGRMELLDDRRQIMARNSAVSKAARNCILRILPLHVKAAFERRVREKMAGGPLNRPAERVNVEQALDWFKTEYGIDEARIVNYIGKPRDVWTGHDLSDLRAVGNALKEGETTVEAVFPIVEVVPSASAAAARARVVDVRDAQLTPTERGQVETPKPPPQPAPEPEPEPPAATKAQEESEVERLKRLLAEAESRNVAIPTPAPAVAPAAAPTTTRSAKAQAPAPAPTPPPAPVAAPMPPAAAPASRSVDDALQAKIDACESIADLDNLLGALYQAGGELHAANRETKRAALVKIGERRDAIVKASAK